MVEIDSTQAAAGDRQSRGPGKGLTAIGLRGRELGYSIKRRAEALDPVRDHQEVARLSFDVLYGDPIIVHAGYLVGFSCQMAVPSIARVVDRGGRGDNLRDVARRTDDTLTFFGEFLRRGHSSPEGRAAIARMERIHGRFPITDEQKRYTLATLIFGAERAAQSFGIDPYTAAQRQANWEFWRGVAEQMPLGGLPASPDDFWRWMLEYEHAHWQYTDGGRRVVDAFFEDWTTRWFPPRARRLGRQILLALMDQDLRAVHGVQTPSKHLERLVRAGARAYFPLTLVRPLRTDRSWVDYFGLRHGAAVDFEHVGHRRAESDGPAGPASESG